jgi:hypothetical protein
MGILSEMTVWMDLRAVPEVVVETKVTVLLLGNESSFSLHSPTNYTI